MMRVYPARSEEQRRHVVLVSYDRLPATSIVCSTNHCYRSLVNRYFTIRRMRRWLNWCETDTISGVARAYQTRTVRDCDISQDICMRVARIALSHNLICEPWAVLNRRDCQYFQSTFHNWRVLRATASLLDRDNPT